MAHLRKNNFCDVKMFGFVMDRNAGISLMPVSFSYLSLKVGMTKPGSYKVVINRSTLGHSVSQTLTVIVKMSKEHDG